MSKKQHYIQSAVVSIFFVAAFAFLVSGNSLTNEGQLASAVDSRFSIYQIEDFVLIDANTNEEVGVLKDGDVINKADYLPHGFSIKAATTPSTWSVRFDVNGSLENIDSKKPFAAGYEANASYRDLFWEPGEYTIVATPHSRKKSRGFKGNAKKVTITLVDLSDPL
jgi:hypothetical protein